ncbi:MAG: YicC family protein, partial [Desulfobulbaceae bacterium]|nr:YicC family protein [Desulfobulbaceae bacterium]
MKRPLSMTSFGRGESVADGTAWTVEIRSVNHRYCDINFKLPRKYAVLEDRMKKEITSFYSRGHIDVMLSYVSSGVGSANLAVNLDLAREYHRSLQVLSKELSLPESIGLAQVAGYKDVIIAQEPEEDIDAIWPAIRTALVQALEGGQAMREQEGATLKEDLLARLHNLESTADAVEKQAPELISKKEAALKERLDNLLKGVDIDPARLAQEVAVMADKADVT